MKLTPPCILPKTSMSLGRKKKKEKTPTSKILEIYKSMERGIWPTDSETECTSVNDFLQKSPHMFGEVLERSVRYNKIRPL